MNENEIKTKRRPIPSAAAIEEILTDFKDQAGIEYDFALPKSVYLRLVVYNELSKRYYPSQTLDSICTDILAEFLDAALDLSMFPSARLYYDYKLLAAALSDGEDFPPPPACG